jgi:glutamyl-tRNA(Gln) amidotransferase subunit E
MLIEVFDKLEKGLIAKESVTLILEKIMKNESKTVKEAMDSLNLTKIGDDELHKILDEILNDNAHIIKEKGINSIGALMGKSMVMLRGKVDGYKINGYLKHKLEHLINDEFST